MGSRQATVDYLVEQMAAAGPVSARRMFGEYAIYREGKLVALVCVDKLYLKPTEAGRSLLGAPAEGAPYPGAKPCFLIPPETWEDADALAALVRATAAELPVPARRRTTKPN